MLRISTFVYDRKVHVEYCSEGIAEVVAFEIVGSTLHQTHWEKNHFGLLQLATYIGPRQVKTARQRRPPRQQFNLIHTARFIAAGSETRNA